MASIFQLISVEMISQIKIKVPTILALFSVVLNKFRKLIELQSLNFGFFVKILAV